MPKFGSYHIPFGGREHEQKLQCRKATSKTEISCCPIIGLYDSGVAHFSFTSEKKCYAEVRKLVQTLPSGFEDKQSYKGLSYTVSPIHSVEQYIALALEMEAMGAQSICIKDMSGSLMPDKAYILGKYGRAPGTIDEAVKEKILKNNLSTEKEGNTYLETKERCLAQNMSQEDMLIYVTFPQLAEKFFAREEENPTDGFTFTCEAHREKGGKLTKLDLNKMDEDVVAVLTAILASYTKVDAKAIRIKSISTYD